MVLGSNKWKWPTIDLISGNVILGAIIILLIQFFQIKSPHNVK